MTCRAMGVQNLQTFLDSGHVEGGAVPVELLKIARSHQRPIKQNRSKPNIKKFSLIIDAECCLDRLYGGYFSDWTCGGQWNRMFQFLSQLMVSCQAGKVELTVAFNGALEQQRMNEWVQKQLKNKAKLNLVLRHVQNKGTPPPKVWWVPPVYLSTALRMALRYYNIPVICTMDDHHQEVIAYCRENNLHGIIADDAEYIVFDPPRYFSATNLKLTYKGLIETKEYLVEQLAKDVDLNTDELCILGALLGNYLLTEVQLCQLHNKLGVIMGKTPVDTTVRNLAAYVKGLQNKHNLDLLANEVLGSDKSAVKKQSFVESVQYYMNGTKHGFLKYKHKKPHKTKPAPKQTEVLPAPIEHNGVEEPLDSSRFASETLESEEGSREAYKIVTAALQHGTYTHVDLDEGEREHAQTNGGTAEVNGESGESSGKGQQDGTKASAGATTNGTKADSHHPKIPVTTPEVLRTACERHQKGLMSPAIYQILTHGELKLPVVMDDESGDISSVHSIYKPMRQNVYAIMFNLHHQMYIAASKEKDKEAKTRSQEEGTAAAAAAAEVSPPAIPDILVKEWTWTPLNQYSQPDMVRAEPIGWPVPTIQRLWFGSSIDDMRRRLRAYLTCMKSDSQLMVMSSYVPQHLLVMASVLRYLIQVKPPVLRRSELDAFIVTAFSPDLMNAETTQDLQLQMVSPRGIYLATVLMQGVEMALLANDACGAPIPWLMCCPWLFFDGKLFHNTLAKTEHVKSLQELCNHRLDVLVKVERMRHAILENLNFQYARRPLPPVTVLKLAVANMPPAGYNPGRVTDSGSNNNNNMRGPPRRPVPSRGGQLEIAGVVVGSWGPNYSLNRGRLPSQAAVGNLRNYGKPGYQMADRAAYSGFGRGMPFNNKKRFGSFNKKNKQKKPVERKPREPRLHAPVLEKNNLGSHLLESSSNSGNSSDENLEQFEDAAAIGTKIATLALEGDDQD